MSKVLIFIFLLIIVSCSSSRTIYKSETNIALLKRLAYCKCMDYSMSLYYKTDSSEISSSLTEELMDTKGLYIKSIMPYIEISAKKTAISLAPSNGKFIHESAVGRNIYIGGCLSYYHSKSLDSLVKSFNKKDYVVSY